MTVLFVDTEHDRILADPARGPAHHAAVAEACARLAAVSGQPCRSLRFPEATLPQIEQIGPTAIVIGGSTVDWADYNDQTLSGLLAAIHAAP